MTVCIAAICQGPGQHVVLAATDRKLTAGDIQFEPPVSKIWSLGPSAVALIAGDASSQAEVCSRVSLRQPQSIQQAVDAYCEELGDYNRRQAERAILFPLGLNMESFLTRQQTMSPDFVAQIHHQFSKVSAGIETIICGADASGCHIYTVDQYGCAQCNTAIGFAAIGDGGWHAASQFMFARYYPNWPLGRALFLLYTAKKRAEVAPGVGYETDLVLLSPLGRVYITEKTQPVLDEAYKKLGEAWNLAWEQSSVSVETLVEQAMKSGQEPPQPPPGSTPPAPESSSPDSANPPSQEQSKPAS